jgi:hypothetical protein
MNDSTKTSGAALETYSSDSGGWTSPDDGDRQVLAPSDDAVP